MNVELELLKRRFGEDDDDSDSSDDDFDDEW